MLFDFVLIQVANSFSPKVSNKEIFIVFNRNIRDNNLNYVTCEFLKNGNSIEDARKMFYLYSREKFSDQKLMAFRKKLFEEIDSRGIQKV